MENGPGVKSPPTVLHVADSAWNCDRENREARRKLRIVRKLQELEEDEQQQVAAHQVIKSAHFKPTFLNLSKLNNLLTCFILCK